MTDVGSVPVVSTGSGFGDGGGIWAIVLLALLGGGGFGSRGNELGREMDFLNQNINTRFNSSDAAAEFRFMAQSNNINHISQLEQLADTQMQICNTDKLILEEGHKNALIEKDTQFQNAQNTCALLTAQNAGTQAILDKLSANEIQALRDKVAELERNVARPAYITYAPGQSVFPPYPAVNAAAVYGAYGLGGGCSGF